MTARLEQRLAALDYANDLRLCMAQIKRELGSTKPKQAALTLLADMLEDFESEPEGFGAIRVEDALRACHRVGAANIRKLLLAARMNGRVRLRDLNPGRRAKLVSVIREQVETGRVEVW